MGKNMESTKDAIEEMRRLKAELPPRPSPESVNFATQMIERVDSTFSTRLDQLSQQPTPSRIPYFVFRAYLQMCEDLMRKEVEKKKSEAVIELEDRHQRFDALIQKAQSAALHALTKNAVKEGAAHDFRLPGATTPDGSKLNNLSVVSEDTGYSEPLSSSLLIGHLESRSFVGSTSARKSDSSANNLSPDTLPQAPSSGPKNKHGRHKSTRAVFNGSQLDHEDNQDGVTQFSSKVLNAIRNGKSQRLAELKLTNMDLKWVPEMVGELTNLTALDLTGNRLRALPESIGELSKLTSLIVQSNQLTSLPETIGCLSNLRILNLRMNKVEELPVTLGLCTQLVELQADFNNLKVLPEATGNLTLLQKLSIYMNHVQRLPTTLPDLKNLVELDVHFNRLERIPDAVCYLPKLTKLDVSSNFTELRELPKAIGQMPSVRELYISNNAISILPGSFAQLTGLEKLELEPNPWVLPPLDVVKRGREAVLAFMAELADQEVTGEQEWIKKPSFGTRLSTIFRKKKSSSSPYVVNSVNPLHLRA